MRGVFFGFWGLVGEGWGEGRDRTVSVVGTMTWDYYKWIIISVLCTRVKVGFYSYAKGMLLLVTSPPPLIPPPPTPKTQKTPHTSCIAAPEKLDRNLKMAHI